MLKQIILLAALAMAVYSADSDDIEVTCANKDGKTSYICQEQIQTWAAMHIGGASVQENPNPCVAEDTDGSVESDYVCTHTCQCYDSEKYFDTVKEAAAALSGVKK